MNLQGKHKGKEPEEEEETAESFFSNLSDDVILNILHKLEDDPRHWARATCVSTKFASLIRTVCIRSKCSRSIPAVVSDLIPTATGWSSLYKLAVCCPGSLHAGVLLENSDFGLERELGPDENYLRSGSSDAPLPASSSHGDDGSRVEVITSDTVWSLYDDLIYDTQYSEAEPAENPVDEAHDEKVLDRDDAGARVCKRRKIWRPMKSHLASGVWDLSREQGNKLLGSRFKGDSLYICNWPGCVHAEEKRNYMLFRGFFKNFKQSRVWRTINEGCSRRRIDLNCAYCESRGTWDLHSSFCLRRHFGYHEDGEPTVRAYVCENGHVSGAWTEQPMFN